MNSIGSSVRQTLRAFQIIQRSRQLTSSFLAGVCLFAFLFAGLSYFISRDRTQFVRVKLFSYALISLEKVNELLSIEEIRPSPNSIVFKRRYRKGLLAQGSAALSVMQANSSLLLPLEARDLQAVILSYALLEKGIHLHWRGPELFDVNRRIVPQITALSFAVEQERDILFRRIDRMLFFRMVLILLSFGGGLLFLLAQWGRNRRVSRQNRFHRSLSRIDRLILSLPDPESLFRSTCRIVIEETQVQAVWIGRYDPKIRAGRWVAYDGKITEELIRRPLSEDPSAPGGQGIWAHTIRNRGSVVWNDLLSSVPEGSLRDFYRANGIQSAAGFPLTSGETFYGALIVQSEEPDYFDKDLIALIASLADNLSFALKNWEREEERKESEERLTSLLENLPEPILFKDGEGRWKLVNHAGLRLFNLEGRTDWVDKPDRELATLQPSLASVYEGCTLSDNAAWKAGGRSSGIETLADAEGNSVILDVTKIPLFNPNGTRKGLVISARNITEKKKSEEIRERYVRIFENVREGIVLTNADRNIIDVNPFFSQTTEYTRSELLGKNPRILHSGRQSQDFYRTMWKTIDREGHWEGEIWNRKKSGEFYCEWISISVLKDGDRVTNYIGIFSDITERKKSENLQAQLGRILDESPSEIYTIDADSLMFVSANAGALKNLGYSQAELRRMTPIDIKPFFTRDSFEKLLAPLRRGEQELLVFQTEHRRKDGSLYPVEIRLQFSRTASPPVFVAIIQDITERKRTERRIEHLATHDALTDLPNRRVFQDRIEHTLLQSERTGECFAVGLLDLDGFKEVNDRLGHPKGDELLIQVGKRLGDLLRKTDTLVRLGGDEFGLLLANLDEGTAYQDLFTKIVESILDPFEVMDAEPVRISGSLGLTLCPPDSGDVTGLIAHADLALYRVKDRGRNGWAIFENGMEESLLEHHRIRTEFEQAIRNGELCLYYQPQVDMAEGQVVGAEALLRWNHPERGFLAPASFIGVVEKSDLILPLGRWVLETAMSQQETWEKEDLTLRISVNIGARHFLSDGFIETLSEILYRHKQSEHLMIEIEVTETEALRDLEKARKTIDTCRNMGISVSLDDFGTGQASLTSLQQLDIKEVKIDIGFVHRMLESQKDLAIVSSLSVAARMMLIDVVAEGVETEEEGEVLLQMGCRVAQGYAIARPMPPERILEWVKEWRPFESWKQQKLEKKSGVPDDTLLMVKQAIKIFLKGILLGLDTPGVIKEEWTNPRKCVPGQWIEWAGRSRYGGTPQFDALERIHDRLHVLVWEALSARDKDNKETLERLKSELTETSHSLREALQKLSE